MKLGLYGGGFKPFTTGHFAKLANAIRDNDLSILFYGMQQQEPTRYGKKGQALSSKQKFRQIGKTERDYNEKVAESIFQIYKNALERIPGVEVIPVYSQASDSRGNPLPIRSPVGAIFAALEDYVDNPESYEKVTIYGDRASMAPYMRSQMFKDFVKSGKIQFGGAIPETAGDYIDKLDHLMTQGEKEARQSLKDFYASKGQEIDEEEIERLQSVRGTEVRNLASMPETLEAAKRFLPPFLNDSEKDEIIQILLGTSDQQAESYLRDIVRGFIRG